MGKTGSKDNPSKTAKEKRKKSKKAAAAEEKAEKMKKLRRDIAKAQKALEAMAQKDSAAESDSSSSSSSSSGTSSSSSSSLSSGADSDLQPRTSAKDVKKAKKAAKKEAEKRRKKEVEKSRKEARKVKTGSKTPAASPSSDEEAEFLPQPHKPRQLPKSRPSKVKPSTHQKAKPIPRSPRSSSSSDSEAADFVKPRSKSKPKVQAKAPPQPSQDPPKRRDRRVVIPDVDTSDMPLRKTVTNPSTGTPVLCRWIWDGAGHPQVIVLGYVYSRHYCANRTALPKDRRLTMRCTRKEKGTAAQCLAQLIFTGELKMEDGDKYLSHTCPQNYSMALRVEILSRLRRYINKHHSDPTFDPTTAHKIALDDYYSMEDLATAELQTWYLVQQSRRVAQIHKPAFKNPEDLDYPVFEDMTPFKYDLSGDGEMECILQWDSGPLSAHPKKHRIVAFWDKNILAELKDVDEICSDGTYKSRPVKSGDWAQVYIVTGRVIVDRFLDGSPRLVRYAPLMYFLLSSHRTETYAEAFNYMAEEFKVGELLDPTVAAFDFERAPGSALLDVFRKRDCLPKLSGCGFHAKNAQLENLKQRMVKAPPQPKTQKKGPRQDLATRALMKVVLDSGRATAQVKLLTNLCNVHPSAVGDVFDYVVYGRDGSNNPILADCLKDWVRYLEATWIGKPNGKQAVAPHWGRCKASYPIRLWNQWQALVDGSLTTTNPSESLNANLNYLTKGRATFKAFADTLAKLMRKERLTQTHMSKLGRTAGETAAAQNAFPRPQEGINAVRPLDSDKEPADDLMLVDADMSDDLGVAPQDIHIANSSDDSSGGQVSGDIDASAISHAAPRKLKKLGVHQVNKLKTQPSPAYLRGKAAAAKDTQKRRMQELDELFEAKAVRRGSLYSKDKALAGFHKHFRSREDAARSWLAYCGRLADKVTFVRKVAAISDQKFGGSSSWDWQPPAPTDYQSGDGDLSSLPSRSSDSIQAADVPRPKDKPRKSQAQLGAPPDTKTDSSSFGEAKTGRPLTSKQFKASTKAAAQADTGLPSNGLGLTSSEEDDDVFPQQLGNHPYAAKVTDNDADQEQAPPESAPLQSDDELSDRAYADEVPQNVTEHPSTADLSDHDDAEDQAPPENASMESHNAALEAATVAEVSAFMFNEDGTPIHGEDENISPCS